VVVVLMMQLLFWQQPPGHELGVQMQVPASQKNPVWQSVWTTQGAPHEFSIHTAGAQLFAAPGWHAPLPSQVLAARSVASWQLPGAHSVPILYRRQAPRPSHIPSRLQLAAGSSTHSSSGS